MIFTVQKIRKPRKKGVRLASIARKINSVWYHNKKDCFMGSTYTNETAVQITLGKCHHLITLAKDMRSKEMSESNDRVIESNTATLDNENE